MKSLRPSWLTDWLMSDYQVSYLATGIYLLEAKQINSTMLLMYVYGRISHLSESENCRLECLLPAKLNDSFFFSFFSLTFLPFQCLFVVFSWVWQHTQQQVKYFFLQNLSHSHNILERKGGRDETLLLFFLQSSIIIFPFLLPSSVSFPQEPSS